MVNEISKFLNEIQELIQANGWEGQLDLETLSDGVRIRLSSSHPSAPSDIVNDYREGQNSLEQVQQECLRALRTGRPGI